MTGPLMTGSFSHVAFAVPDVRATARELAEAAGLAWAPVQRQRLGEWDYDIVFSRSQPFVELVAGPAGSPWQCHGSPRFHHLGWWAADLERESARLRCAGLEVEYDGRADGRSFAYHRASTLGGLVELVDVSRQAPLAEAWSQPFHHGAVLGDDNRAGLAPAANPQEDR